MSKKENKLTVAESEFTPRAPGPSSGPAADSDSVVQTPSSTPGETAAVSAPPQLSPEQIEELKAKAAKAEEYWDRVLRTAAELDNYKKRAARERLDAVKYANESLLEKLVPALDNFDMALAAANNPQSGTADSIKTGISMIYNQLKAAVAEAGLEEIDATNKPFDANWHEAVSEQESAEVPEGQVLQQLRKGYKLRERLIRPAAVVVAKKPAA